MGIVEQAAIEGLQQRLLAAAQGFQALNQHAEPGAEYGPHVGWDASAAIAALVELLVAKSVLTNEEFLIHTLTLQVQSLEGSLQEAAADLRERTGIIVPIGLAGRGQG